MEFGVTFVGLQTLIDRAAALGANVQPLMTAALTKSATEIQRVARSNAPHRTGNLQRSILVAVDYPVARVNVNEKYGLYVEQGTRPHDILPKKKKALFWAGAQNPYAIVHHPGTKANPFFERSLIETQEYIRQTFLDVANIITKQLAGV